MNVLEPLVTVKSSSTLPPALKCSSIVVPEFQGGRKGISTSLVFLVNFHESCSISRTVTDVFWEAAIMQWTTLKLWHSIFLWDLDWWKQWTRKGDWAKRWRPRGWAWLELQLLLMCTSCFFSPVKMLEKDTIPFCMKFIHVVLEVYLLMHRVPSFSHKADNNGAIFQLERYGFLGYSFIHKQDSCWVIWFTPTKLGFACWGPGHIVWMWFRLLPPSSELSMIYNTWLSIYNQAHHVFWAVHTGCNMKHVLINDISQEFLSLNKA